MRPPIEQNSTNEHGDEQHPAWVVIGASRISHSPPGAVLFDSDIKHQHTVVVTLKTATRKRDLHRDWIHSKKQLIEVEMSEAQWASFVSSMNAGDGVPATLRWTREDGDIASLPYEPRLAESIAEVREKAQESVITLNEAFAAYEEKKTKANLDTLKYAIRNMPKNLEFAAESLTEHAENVVQRARADVAMVLMKAEQLRIDPAELGGTRLLEGGDPE